MRLLIVLGIATAVAGGGWLGRHVPFSEQWPMFEALRTTAAIIFAVVGAWMAIIYPERLRLSFRSESTEQKKSSSNGTGWGQLFYPVVHSTAILAVLLVLGITAPILKYNPVERIPCEVINGVSYGLLVMLTLWQLWTVVLTLFPADRIKSYLDREDATDRSINDFMAGSATERRGKSAKDE